MHGGRFPDRASRVIEIVTSANISREPPFADLVTDMMALETAGLGRRLQARGGVDFSSNDYLGLSRSAELSDAVAAAVARGVPVGSGGSRLLRGNDPEHEALEAEAAAWFGCEAALYFPTGFAANTTSVCNGTAARRPDRPRCTDPCQRA